MPAHEEGSAPTQQPQKPCAKKRRLRAETVVVVQPGPELPNLYPPEDDFTKPDDLQTPCEYFSQFFSRGMIGHLSLYTNLTRADILHSNICYSTLVEHLPPVEDYWSLQLRYDQAFK